MGVAESAWGVHYLPNKIVDRLQLKITILVKKNLGLVLLIFFKSKLIANMVLYILQARQLHLSLMVYTHMQTCANWQLIQTHVKIHAFNRTRRTKDRNLHRPVTEIKVSKQLS